MKLFTLCLMLLALQSNGQDTPFRISGTRSSYIGQIDTTGITYTSPNLFLHSSKTGVVMRYSASGISQIVITKEYMKLLINALEEHGYTLCKLPKNK